VRKLAYELERKLCRFVPHHCLLGFRQMKQPRLRANSPMSKMVNSTRPARKEKYRDKGKESLQA
jgi:hypothetical protein